jgi:hypothetical protein
MQALDVGLPWYRRSDYQRIREIMLDGDIFEPTFDKWQGLAEKAERKFKARGQRPHRAIIEPDKFIAWCAANGREVDAHGRTGYAADPANWSDLN